jgi:hypothetical protein
MQFVRSAAEMLVSPRETIRGIVDRDPTQYVIFLAWWSGTAGLLYSMILSADEKKSELPVVALVILAAYMGPLMGFFYVYLAAALTRLTGGMLGGSATFADCRAAIAWGSLPLVGALLLCPFASSLPGLFTYLGLVIWMLVIQVAALAEVHRLSTARGVLAAFLAWLLYVAFVVAMVLAYWTSR